MPPVLKRLLLALIACGALLGGGACKGGALPIPPPPTFTAATGTSSSSATTTATATETRTTTGTQTATSTPIAPVGLNIETDRPAISFPDKITFSLAVTSADPVTAVNLVYGSDKRSLVPETNSITPTFSAGTTVNATWSWDMKKLGSVPPGATVWWYWEVTDSSGKTTETQRRTVAWADTRFQWSTRTMTSMDVYWHDQLQSLIDTLISEINSRLSRLQLNVAIPADRKPKIMIYRSSEELKDAMLHEQEWTGAVAFTEYNIILTALDSSILEWAKAALPHEITHLMVAEAVFGPFGDVPNWLNEGLAEYGGGGIPAYEQEALDDAVQNSTLISLRSLSSSFPADAAGAYLAYAESASVVQYLIDNHGWEKMRALLATFKDGATYDSALKSVYSFDMAGLEAAWKASIGAR